MAKIFLKPLIVMFNWGIFIHVAATNGFFFKTCCKSAFPLQEASKDLSLKLPCGFKTAVCSSSRGLRTAVEQYNRRVKENLKNSKPFARMNIYIYLI
jgi:hypothetical protein